MATRHSVIEPFLTARLSAEPFSLGHLDELAALHQDEAVMRHLGGVHTAEQTSAYLDVNLRHWRRFGFGIFALRLADGRFAGRAGLRHMDLDGVDELEIAYTFAQDLWGLGYASEIATALIAKGFGELGLSSLVGVTTTGNQASRHVLSKAGFTLERDWVSRGHKVVVYRLAANR